jgi:hypothetical protein
VKERIKTGETRVKLVGALSLICIASHDLQVRLGEVHFGPGGRGAKIGHFGAGGVKNVKIGLRLKLETMGARA